MKNINTYLILFGFFLIWSWQACEEAKPKTDYINSVLYDRIIFEDGSEQELNLESGDQMFFLIRHAEKDTAVKNDPGLTSMGENRAAVLAEMLKKVRIDEVYSTVYMRTLLTVDSLVRSKGIAIKPYDPSELKAFADTLKNQENLKSALVVGHSNTTPALAKALTDSEELLVINESEYDHLFLVIHRDDGSTELLQLKYRNTITQ